MERTLRSLAHSERSRSGRTDGWPVEAPRPVVGVDGWDGEAGVGHDQAALSWRAVGWVLVRYSTLSWVSSMKASSSDARCRDSSWMVMPLAAARSPTLSVDAPGDGQFAGGGAGRGGAGGGEQAGQALGVGGADMHGAAARRRR